MSDSQEQSQLSDNGQLSDLRKQINLSSALLVDVVGDDDKFVEKIKELNESGIACIMKENYYQSLVYLQEAQKILQYAANCGKTIDRVIIIFTLENQACAYQRLWELEKASNYLEASIYNMNAYIECSPDLVIISDILNSFSQSYQNLSAFISKRIKIVKYYLKFSAINSQIKKHQVALTSAFKALSMLKLACEQCYNYERYTQKVELSHEVRLMLKELASVKESVDLEKCQKYIKLARKGLIQINSKNIYIDENSVEFEEFANFSIGDVMQINPTSMNNLLKNPSLEQEVSYFQKIYKALYVSICYFAIATELRLITDEQYKQQQRQQSIEFHKSKLYHLNSIIVACKYAPKINKYIEHILKSFQNHYEIDLTEVGETREDDNEEEHNLIVQEEQKQDKLIINENQDPLTQKTQLGKTNQERFYDQVKTPLLLDDRKKKKKSKSKCKSIQKIESQPLLKNSYFPVNIRRKSLVNKSKEKLRVKMSPMNNLLHKGAFERSKQKGQKRKSKDKSKSFSRKDLSLDKKEKSIEKKTKKSNKLQEEYFLKANKKKVVTPKPNNLSKNKLNDYMGSSSKMQNLMKPPSNKLPRTTKL